MRSIVEKTLRVRSDLTGGIRRHRRNVHTVRMGSPMPGQAGGGDPPRCLDRPGLVSRIRGYAWPDVPGGGGLAHKWIGFCAYALGRYAAASTHGVCDVVFACGPHCNRNKIVFSIKRSTKFARIKFSPVRNLVEANVYGASLEPGLTISEVVFPGSFETLIKAKSIRLLARTSESAAAIPRAYARSFRQRTRSRQA